MSGRVLIISFLLALFFSISCSKTDTKSYILDIKGSKQIDLVSEGYDTPGSIVRISKLDSSRFVFLDFSYREIFIYDQTEGEIEVVGNKGSGPGEYRIPAFLFVDRESNILFSDGSNSKISKLDKNGIFQTSIVHEYGGAARFYYEDGIYYVRSSIKALIAILNDKGETIKEMIPLNSISGGELFKNIEGGGVLKRENSLYVMNSLEPKVYEYLIEEDRLVIHEIAEFKDAYDKINIGSITLKELFDSIGSIRINIDTFFIEVDGKERLAFTTMYNKKLFITVLDESFSVLLTKELDKAVIGSSGKYIFQYDTKKTDGKIDIQYLTNN